MNERQSRRDAGPLAAHVEGFREHLEGLGYAPDSIRWRLRQFAALDRWLCDQGLTVGDLDAGCVAELVATRRAEKRTTFVAVANFGVPLAYLRGIGAVPSETPAPDATTQILQQYRRYLVAERGLVESSIPVYMHVAEAFCEQRDRRLDVLTTAEVSAYVADLSARSSVGWAKKTVSALASLLRFLHVIGVTAQPLVHALPKVAGHRRNVPGELGEDNFARLLASCDCSTDVGLRDHAILIILWRLGLRRGEVAGLRIDDIDWRRGVITIRGKGNRHEALPIPIEVGEAIVRYLHDGHRRVPTHCRALFVQVRAPEGAMKPCAVSDVVNRASSRAGLGPMGAHQLRHGTATQLIRDGASWPETSQLMRHRNAAVTASYATIDPALASELARPWPGAR